MMKTIMLLKYQKEDLPVKLPENIDLNVNGNPLDSQTNGKN